VGCPADPGVLPAQMLHVAARKAHNALWRGQGSSHESFHDHQAEGLPIVTQRSQELFATPAVLKLQGATIVPAGSIGSHLRSATAYPERSGNGFDLPTRG
jgi:hypothetical protein